MGLYNYRGDNAAPPHRLRAGACLSREVSQTPWDRPLPRGEPAVPCTPTPAPGPKMHVYFLKTTFFRAGKTAVAFCWCVSSELGTQKTLEPCQPGLSSCRSSETPNELLSLSFLFCKVKTVMCTLFLLVGTDDYTRGEVV